MQRTHIAMLAAFGLVISLAAAPQKEASAAAKMQAAVHKQTVDGDLRGAIEQYAAIVARYAKTDRATAAAALIRMAECHQAMGDAEAAKIYGQVVREYGDQKEAVAEARKRLQAKTNNAETGPVARQIAVTGDRQYGRGISRDGRFLTFTNQGSMIGLHDLSTGEVRSVMSKPTPDARFCCTAISPDGRHIAYLRRASGDSDGLYIVGADGSNPHRLVGGTDHLVPSEWSPDGKQLLAQLDSEEKGPQIALVSVADGSSRIVASAATDGSLSPDGRYIAFVKTPSGGEWGVGDIVLTRAEGGPEIPLVSGRYQEPLWTPDGKRLLVVTERNGNDQLWAIPLSNSAAAGLPEFVKAGVSTLLAASQNGDYYFQSIGRDRDVYVADIDPEAGRLVSRPRQLTRQDLNFGAAWSPDGEYLAYYSQRGPQGGSKLTLVIRSTKTGEERELPCEESFFPTSRMPQWFPDSRSLLVHSSSDGKLHRFDMQTREFQSLLGEASIAPYVDGTAFQFYRNFVLIAPDGKSLYYLVRDRDAKLARVHRRSLDGGPETEICRIASSGINGFAISPDGSRLLFNTSDPFPGPGPKGNILTVSTSGGEPREIYRSTTHWLHDSVWTKDGRQVLVMVDFGQGDKDIALVPAEGGEARPLGIGLHMKYFLSMHPSGRQIAFTDEQGHNYLGALNNLFPDAKAKRVVAPK